MTTVGAGAKTWVEISASALSKNIQALRSLLEPEAVFQAVVKANAYGHDLDTIVRLAITEGVTHFGVDSIDEALLVRKRAPNAEIYILGYTVPERFPDVVKHDFVQTIYRLDSFQLLAQEAVRQQQVVRISLKIETGTRRQGADPKKLEPFFIELRRNERFVNLHAVSSHFADAEDPDHPEYTTRQHNTFCEALATIHNAGFRPEIQHIACSAAAILYPETQFTLSRFGIALYGLWSSEALRRKNRVSGRSIELTPVMSWKTRIAQIKDVPAGSSVGYSHGFVSNRPLRVAVLPVGYHDGLRRSYATKGEVLVRGQRCKIVGNICMNMCMVDVSLLPQLGVGDTVTLLGRNGMHQITAEEIAERTGTINYEIVTAVNPLLPRFVV